MSNGTLLIKGVKTLFDARPLIAVRIYAALTAIGMYLFVVTYSDYRYYSSTKPQLISLAQIANVEEVNRSPLVNLTGIQWKCSKEINSKSDKVIPIIESDEDGENLVLYLPPQDFSSCSTHRADATVSGAVAHAKPRYLSYLRSVNFTPIDDYEDSNIWTLCGDCNANDSLLGMCMSLVFLLIVVSALVFYLKRYFVLKKLAAYDAYAEESVRKLL